MTRDLMLWVLKLGHQNRTRPKIVQVTVIWSFHIIDAVFKGPYWCLCIVLPEHTEIIDQFLTVQVAFTVTSYSVIVMKSTFRTFCAFFNLFFVFLFLAEVHDCPCVEGEQALFCAFKILLGTFVVDLVICCKKTNFFFFFYWPN